MQVGAVRLPAVGFSHLGLVNTTTKKSPVSHFFTKNKYGPNIIISDNTASRRAMPLGHAFVLKQLGAA